MNNLKKPRAIIAPKSKKAKNRFCNQMESNPVCIVEQSNSQRLFLASSNDKYFFWVDLVGDDNWSIETILDAENP
jgi:hypothetical protein